MPLYWENAKRELREVRHGGDRDYDEYDDHHRRSGYASQNTLEVNHGMLLRKIIQALVELGKKECPQPLATTLILIRFGYYDTASRSPRLKFGWPFRGDGDNGAAIHEDDNTHRGEESAIRTRKRLLEINHPNPRAWEVNWAKINRSNAPLVPVFHKSRQK